MKGVNEMSRNLDLSEEWKQIVGNECFNCGSSINVCYRYIVPISKRGRKVKKNIVCLCEECAKAVDGPNNTIGHTRSGRKTNISDEAAFHLFDMLANGEIGLIKCMRELGYSDNTRLSRSPQYNRWRESTGVKRIKTNYDYVATNNPFYLRNGNIIGTLVTEDGEKNLLYNYNPENDVEYCMVKFMKDPNPMTVTEFYERSGISPNR